MNNMVLQGDILSALMLIVYLYWPRHQAKEVCFRVKEWVFCSIVLYRLALDRTMVQSSNLVYLESDVEAIE